VSEVGFSGGRRTCNIVQYYAVSAAFEETPRKNLQARSRKTQTIIFARMLGESRSTFPAILEINPDDPSFTLYRYLSEVGYLTTLSVSRVYIVHYSSVARIQKKSNYSVQTLPKRHEFHIPYVYLNGEVGGWGRR
jgi:hypothetical protein